VKNETFDLGTLGCLTILFSTIQINLVQLYFGFCSTNRAKHSSNIIWAMNYVWIMFCWTQFLGLICQTKSKSNTPTFYVVEQKLFNLNCRPKSSPTSHQYTLSILSTILEYFRSCGIKFFRTFDSVFWPSAKISEFKIKSISLFRPGSHSTMMNCAPAPRVR
jgi:hypothetical protein